MSTVDQYLLDNIRKAEECRRVCLALAAETDRKPESRREFADIAKWWSRYIRWQRNHLTVVRTP